MSIIGTLNLRPGFRNCLFRRRRKYSRPATVARSRSFLERWQGLSCKGVCQSSGCFRMDVSQGARSAGGCCHMVVHSNVTKHPASKWTAQQIVGAFSDGESPRNPGPQPGLLDSVAVQRSRICGDVAGRVAFAAAAGCIGNWRFANGRRYACSCARGTAAAKTGGHPMGNQQCLFRQLDSGRAIPYAMAYGKETRR
jgi:hypothetical protein